jgi:CheY-like chemotaxis protein
MNILIVDDLAANRKLLRAQLEAEGFMVVEAADGVEALQVLAREPLDAVISDILMPLMDGYRLCHEVRKTPALQQLRFILHSSTYTAPDDVRLSATVGADQFIAKPAPIAAILAALQAPPIAARPRPSVLADEAIVLRQYSTVLVAKLEEKNTELQQALDASRRAHERIQELNADLERRVGERTAELVHANAELTSALAEVKQLNGLLPICSYCKSIRDGKD